MTALKAHEVERFLQAPDLPNGVFLAYGPDNGLVREVTRRIVQHFSHDSTDPMAHTILDAQELETEPSRLAMEARTPSLFGGKRTIRVRGAGKSLVHSLSLLLEDMPEAVIAIEAGNLRPADSLRKLAETHKFARTLPCYADNEKALGELIRKTFLDAGISYAPEIIAGLRDLLGNDREITRQELEKLVLFAYQSKQISMEDVVNLCGDNSSQAIDAIIDAIGSGHAANFDEAFRSATASGVDPQRILSTALMHFATLRRMRTRLDAGTPLKEILNTARPRPHFSRMAAMERQLRMWSDDSLSAACSRIHAAVLESRKNSLLNTQIAQRSLLAICVAAAHR